VHLRVGGGLDGVAATRAVPVSAPDGRTLRLGDIAEVSRGLADPPASAVYHEGRNAVLLSVAKQRGFNVLALGGSLAAELAAIRADLPVGLELAPISDQPRVVTASVSEFLQKFAAALGVVLVVSFLSLGLRAGVIVALSVPLTLACVFLLMLWWGHGTGAHLARRPDPRPRPAGGRRDHRDRDHGGEAGGGVGPPARRRLRLGQHGGADALGHARHRRGLHPVGFAASTSGEYAGGIFWVVGAALIASWLVAVWFTPWLGAKLLPTPKRVTHHEALYDTRPYRALRRVVAWCVDHRIVVLLTTVAVLGAGFVGMGATRKQFFPTSARLELLVDVNLRQGAGFEATRDALARIAAQVAADEDAATHTAYVGAGAPRFFLALNPDLPNESFGKLIVQARDVPARERLRERLIAFAEGGAVPEARIRVSRLDFGPPVGFPVQFRVMGGSPEDLRRVAEEVMAALRATPGTRDVQLAWGERAPAMRLALDQERVAQLGLSPQAVAQSMQTLLSGAAGDAAAGGRAAGGRGAARARRGAALAPPPCRT
jgi:multidrug efflux pump subunit AcrB